VGYRGVDLSAQWQAGGHGALAWQLSINEAFFHQASVNESLPQLADHFGAILSIHLQTDR
jgi:hypothetical protein